MCTEKDKEVMPDALSASAKMFAQDDLFWAVSLNIITSMPGI